MAKLEQLRPGRYRLGFTAAQRAELIYQDKVWVDANQFERKLEHMTTAHLQNVERVVIAAGYSLLEEAFWDALTWEAEARGDMSSYYASQAVDQLSAMSGEEFARETELCTRIHQILCERGVR